MIIERYEQRTKEWYDGRLGCITMSNCKALLTGGKGATRRSYLMDVAAERITGVAADGYKSWAMQRGIDLEPFAFEAYKAVMKTDMQHIGLVYMDDTRRVSCSPDGIQLDDEGKCTGGVEIKCLAPKNHLKVIEGWDIPKEFIPQCQGAMFVTGARFWDWVSFCPEVTHAPIAIFRLKPDPEMIARIYQSVFKGLDEIDNIVEAASQPDLVDQAVLDICAEALAELEMRKIAHSDGIPED